MEFLAGNILGGLFAAWIVAVLFNGYVAVRGEDDNLFVVYKNSVYYLRASKEKP